MTLRIGETAPNFQADTTEGRIDFHQWIGDKWAVLILILVRDEPMRFNALRRTIEGISQTMLSQVLKSLERDGLIRLLDEPDVSIDDFRWKKRVLLIALPAIEDGRRSRQEQELAPLKDSLTAWGIEVVVAPPGHPARARLPVAEHDFVITLIGMPLVLVYTAFVYHRFRGKVDPDAGGYA